ncbi:uncharacterized protein TA21315 [Theileria annulata]|uniref:Uncharacterized protein n=1 Tax=Theileria annulata TaxID=5874 RepID=Q4UGP4_THEAN|nr:uncharacterized protein TA21315 [Theileria annulata]CAI73745.1 hypothetical protein TA21315 [Theileria annulata]|eukprot:XP_954422.1 hypothetical protein TA21315 [Theileria annulata]
MFTSDVDFIDYCFIDVVVILFTNTLNAFYCYFNLFVPLICIMNTTDDLSSNDEAQNEEESSKSKLNLTEENVKELISNLLLSSFFPQILINYSLVVEYLTKIAVTCEGDNVADPTVVKTLMKHMYQCC